MNPVASAGRNPAEAGKEGGALAPASDRAAEGSESHGGKRVPGGHSGAAASDPQWEKNKRPNGSEGPDDLFEPYP